MLLLGCVEGHETQSHCSINEAMFMTSRISAIKKHRYLLPSCRAVHCAPAADGSGECCCTHSYNPASFTRWQTCFFRQWCRNSDLPLSISSLQVRMLGDNAAVVSYIRLQQKLDSNQRPITVATEETRVWQKVNGAWKNVHFHRSPTTPSS